MLIEAAQSSGPGSSFVMSMLGVIFTGLGVIFSLVKAVAAYAKLEKSVEHLTGQISVILARIDRLESSVQKEIKEDMREILGEVTSQIRTFSK